jgi:LmbE family N-acetylglucosaminyl deacetylase
VFFHAHPDDEAIFTGGVIALLASAGWHVVVVFATSGDLDGVDGPLAACRRAEAAESCRLLGAAPPVFLPYSDSGLDGVAHQDAFASTPVSRPATLLASLLSLERASLLVSYDAHGVYGHRDHVHAHRVAATAALEAGVDFYQVTVDREHLHFVDTHHLVGLATGAAPQSGAWGVPTVEVSSTVDVSSQLSVKREAILAHVSQVHPASVEPGSFEAVYGVEWFIHRPGLDPLDVVAARVSSFDPPPAAPGPAPALLGEAGLRSVAAELAAGVLPGPPSLSERSWVKVQDGPDHNAWAIFWPPGSRIEPHGHGDVEGFVRVVSGELVEDVFDQSGVSSTLLRPSDSRFVSSQCVHQVSNVSSRPAVSVHVYSPPLSSTRSGPAPASLQDAAG